MQHFFAGMIETMKSYEVLPDIYVHMKLFDSQCFMTRNRKCLLQLYLKSKNLKHTMALYIKLSSGCQLSFFLS